MLFRIRISVANNRDLRIHRWIVGIVTHIIFIEILQHERQRTQSSRSFLFQWWMERWCMYCSCCQIIFWGSFNFLFTFSFRFGIGSSTSECKVSRDMNVLLEQHLGWRMFRGLCFEWGQVRALDKMICQQLFCKKFWLVFEWWFFSWVY